METLTEFLQEYTAEERAKAPIREAERKEWVAAVERLMVQLQDWLTDADTNCMLRVSIKVVKCNEPYLGEYEVPSLVVRYRGRTVRVLPVARDIEENRTLLASQRRDASQVIITDGAIEYPLYFHQGRHGEYWTILDDDENYFPRRLDRDAFEAALIHLWE